MTSSIPPPVASLRQSPSRDLSSLALVSGSSRTLLLEGLRKQVGVSKSALKGVPPRGVRGHGHLANFVTF